MDAHVLRFETPAGTEQDQEGQGSQGKEAGGKYAIDESEHPSGHLTRNFDSKCAFCFKEMGLGGGEPRKGDDGSGAASKVEAIDCRDAAAKLAKELPPELASRAEFIVKALQRAATHEMLGGVQTRPENSVPTQKLAENPEGPVATKPVPAEVSRADGLQNQKPTQNPEAPSKTKPNEPEVSRADGVRIQKPTQNAEVASKAKPNEPAVSTADGVHIQKSTQNPEAPPETKAEAHSDHDGEECDSQGGDVPAKKSGKREKTEDEKAHHAAWMRMHRQIRSGGLQEMDLMRVWVARDEERLEKEETSFEFKMDCRLECEATKSLLRFGCRATLKLLEDESTGEDPPVNSRRGENNRDDPKPPKKERPDELQKSLLKSLQPVVAQMQKAYNEAQQVWADEQEDSYEHHLSIIKKMMESYDSATVHIKVHAKPKSQPKAKGKGKATQV
ncbi:unnamed protein product [Symbiodinium necroappetens]|uniref:Uncharacterized protein n=1 Tax=Symbiodinium necroappetens TaxID=1628268 RepID=A0A812PD80_9DINO|nr:unnamed protein product [Symbiodinium necroappetens]